MVQLYANGTLIYDPGLEGYELLELTATVSGSAGGTAEIVMPPDHPAYDVFVAYRTIVTIYRNDELIFRGRALYNTDDFYGRRTITCEGERCFLRDAVMEPYLYQTSPLAIFTDVINRYNAQVESFKQFRIGTVSVTDPNNYQYIESETATRVSDVIDKLIDTVGGYITFSTASDGARLINWLESFDRESKQTIEFGENLLDYSRSNANEDLATVIYPYGAKDEETGQRVTIESVNDGLRYIEDAAAVAIRGRISLPVFWDDVTEPSNLLAKAKKYLKTSRMIISSLELSAVDLSAVDRDIDTFRVGDNVRVVSAPHGVDDYFELKERSYNLLDPSQDRIVLGKELLHLTVATKVGEKNTITELHRIEQSIKTDYKIYVGQALEDVPTNPEFSALTQRVEVNESAISQNSSEIATKVSRTEYEVAMGTKADADDLDALGTRVSTAESTISQQADQIKTKVSQSDFNALGTRVSTAESTISQQADQIKTKVSQSDFNTLSGRVSTAESNISQNATAISSKVSQSDFNALGTRVGTAESAITQNANNVTAEFNKVGLAGKQTGITKVDESGIEVTHSNIGGKTSMNADGFRLYDAFGNVIGGLISLNGSVMSAVQRLANIKDTTFFVEVAPNIYGDGENGLRFFIGRDLCGALTAYSLDGEVGVNIRSSGKVKFHSGESNVSLDDVYAVGHRVHFSATDPGGNDGDIWLKPVEVD